ncbi:nuclear transport factor 2 family protein [Luteimonas sp. R10]|uniref:nuclear transport factor 2 family protein n=1 Tax=Luteimonas sp. R10 TaxID=3108176 RepID=UPI00308D831B|nr:nuclear transport factor 2 family protein [Luteimonas sp. R10]
MTASAHSTYELRRLNDGYVRAFLESDVGWFERHLAADFRCILSSGALVDRAAFLRNIAQPVAMKSFDIEDVSVRFVGDVAVVQARTRYETPEGRRGGSRYTDLWVLRDGRWQALVAQITAISEPASP